MFRVLIAIAAAAALVGCGTSDDRAEARGVVERFYDAVRHEDGDAACALLSDAARKAVESQSGEACAAAITRLDYAGGAIARAQVFVTSARVDLGGGESAYLDRGADGWRISAVGCKAQEGLSSEVPMDCEAEA
jgi:hypothetical protein